jgi:hexokinase
MISGMYLGEVARLVLVDLVHAGVLFAGKYPPSQDFVQPYKFETAFMSRIER